MCDLKLNNYLPSLKCDQDNNVNYKFLLKFWRHNNWSSSSAKFIHQSESIDNESQSNLYVAHIVIAQ